MKLDLIDVFCSSRLSGNPLAVVRGGEALDHAAMLRLTQWLGYSETVFLLPPTDSAADYRARIFYPAGELPFAGHPTLGAAHAWSMSGGEPTRAGRIVQECGIGLVEVRPDDAMLFFKAPPLIRSGALDDTERAQAVRVAGVGDAHVLAAVHASNGPRWQLLHLRSAQDVLAAEPMSHAAAGTDIALMGPSPDGDPHDFEVRAFFADQTGRLKEDPVTGSLNAAVAQYVFAAGLAQRSYVAAQGRKVGADGRIYCRQDANGDVWVGGNVTTVVRNGELQAASCS